jgi:tetratricopeptide (TPR) repeat protein
MVTRFQSNEDGISSLKEVLQRHPTELIALNYLGDTHSVLNDHGAAQAIWAEYLRLVPDSPYAHGRLSKALARQNKHAEAIASAKKALELAPTSRAARLELGSRFIDANQLDDAVATLAQIPEPKGEAVLRLGWAHWLKGDIDTAAIHFRKSLETATAPSEWRTRGRAHYNLALVESARGRLGAAKVEFKASLLTGYRVRTVDPLLEATATDVERSGFAQPASPDAGTRMKLAPTESSLVPFDPTGEALPNLKKDPPPEGFILYKF